MYLCVVLGNLRHSTEQNTFIFFYLFKHGARCDCYRKKIYRKVFLNMSKIKKIRAKMHFFRKVFF